MRRGEIVEDVEPPLPLTTPLLLVKPPLGLSTPEVFRALDLGRRSTADPLELLKGLAARGAVTPELCVNDLEQPAFDVLPSLAQLKQRLIEESEGRFSAVFMTGVYSSTLPCTLRYNCAWCIGCCTTYSFLFIFFIFLFYVWAGASEKSSNVSNADGDLTRNTGAGSGSTIVGVGSDEAPAFLQQPELADLFMAPARLIARESGAWYQPSKALAAVS